MSVTGTPTAHGIPTFADADSPDLAVGGLGSILSTLDGLIGSYKIAEANPSGALIDFTSIPQTFSHLVVQLVGRDTAAAAFNSLFLRLNNDSGANYDYQQHVANGATSLAVESAAQTQGLAAEVPAATAPADLYGEALIVIPYYTDSNHQQVYRANSSNKWGVPPGNMVTRQVSGWWRGLGAVNRITLINTFAAGTKATLYGVL